MLVGFSGGVDSSLLAVSARNVLGKSRAVAAIGKSPSLPASQLDQARRIAERFDLDLREIATDELDDPEYVANSTQRCYYCKRELWGKMLAAARELGISAVAEGTTVDDLSEHRPGLAASGELSVVKPLVDAGYTKEMVREEARYLGIPIWDVPSAPCLSSRVLYGLEVTPDRLYQVERGEAFLRDLGIAGDLRLRHHGDEARIEVAVSEFSKVRDSKRSIVAEFAKLGFAKVTLDLSGYRRGSLLVQSTPDLEILSQQRE